MPLDLGRVLFLLFLIYINRVKTSNSNSHWLKLAKEDIERARAVRNIEGIAKNVILFVGDGMGLTTSTAARIYSKKEAGHLAFDKFPHVGLLKTYNADKLVPDSSSTATALFSGVKTNYKTSGVDASVKLDDCAASLKAEVQLENLMTWGQQVGKSTGFVTTTRVTHATPSALYAHTPNRNWECEEKMSNTARECKDIARQLVEDEPGKNINVIMGGGRQMLQSNVSGNSRDPVDTWACYSQDGRDLVTKWTVDKKAKGKTYAVISNTKQLVQLDHKTNFVLGIFSNGHMPMNYARDKSPDGQPSLANMTSKTIDILSVNTKGFILVVEGGLIDYAHHRGHARQALDETVAFSDAIEAAIQKTNIIDTLIIVTSDHAHSLVFTGYPSRQNSILGIAQKSKIENTPYTTLLYGTGGANNYQYKVINGTVSRLSPSLNDTTSFGYSQQAAVLTDEVTHGGSDVVVYAQGPMAHLFHSVHEQTYVAYVISFAAKIGYYKESSKSEANSMGSIFYASIVVLLLRIFKYV